MTDETKTQQVGNKRTLDDADASGGAQRDPKRLADSNGEPSAAPGTYSGDDAKIVPKPQPGLTASKDENMFYPENYDKFDPNCLVADGDPQKSKVCHSHFPQERSSEKFSTPKRRAEERCSS